MNNLYIVCFQCGISTDKFYVYDPRDHPGQKLEHIECGQGSTWFKWEELIGRRDAGGGIKGEGAAYHLPFMVYKGLYIKFRCRNLMIRAGLMIQLRQIQLGLYEHIEHTR